MYRLHTYNNGSSLHQIIQFIFPSCEGMTHFFSAFLKVDTVLRRLWWSVTNRFLPSVVQVKWILPWFPIWIGVIMAIHSCVRRTAGVPRWAHFIAMQTRYFRLIGFGLASQIGSLLLAKLHWFSAFWQHHYRFGNKPVTHLVSWYRLINDIHLSGNFFSSPFFSGKA